LRKVLYLKSFTYENKISRIVKEQVKKISLTEGEPISVVTHVPVTGYVRKYLAATTTTGYTFMNANVDNI
jgi:hypothetical protein